jgi:hypothetical protein
MERRSQRGPGTAASEQSSPVPQLVKFLTEIASLLATASALLFYFGFIRSQAQARAFGADTSIFGMSTQDFVLRSADVIFLPVLALLLLILLALFLHRRLTAVPDASDGERTRRSRRIRRVAAFLRLIWLMPIVVGIPLLVLRPAAGTFALPFLFAVAVGGGWYLATLRRYLPGSAAVPSSVTYVMAALMVISLFWMTERVARVGGEARADGIKDNMASVLQGVTVYSADRLQLAGEGIVERRLDDPEAAYRFRYDGFYLLQRSGGYYFLLTDGWRTGRGRMAMLSEAIPVRLEFGPGR